MRRVSPMVWKLHFPCRMSGWRMRAAMCSISVPVNSPAGNVGTTSATAEGGRGDGGPESGHRGWHTELLRGGDDEGHVGQVEGGHQGDGAADQSVGQAWVVDVQDGVCGWPHGDVVRPGPTVRTFGVRLIECCFWPIWVKSRASEWQARSGKL